MSLTAFITLMLKLTT